MTLARLNNVEDVAATNGVGSLTGGHVDEA